MPPDVTTMPLSPTAARQRVRLSAMASISSGTNSARTSSAPRACSARASQGKFVSAVRPASSSSPMATNAARGAGGGADGVRVAAAPRAPRVSPCAAGSSGARRAQGWQPRGGSPGESRRASTERIAALPAWRRARGAVWLVQHNMRAPHTHTHDRFEEKIVLLSAARGGVLLAAREPISCAPRRCRRRRGCGCPCTAYT